MQVIRVRNIESYQDPLASDWAGIEPSTVNLMATPLPLQPTDYIKVKWANKPYGVTPSVQVAAVHDGETAAFRMQWACEQKHLRDAAAVALPLKGQPGLMTMGQPGAPMQMLHWHEERGINLVQAEGLGTTDPGPKIRLAGKAHWQDGQRRLVIQRPLGSGGGVASMLAGKQTLVAFAIWQGSNEERAGLKAFSIAWQNLDVDA